MITSIITIISLSCFCLYTKWYLKRTILLIHIITTTTTTTTTTTNDNKHNRLEGGGVHEVVPLKFASIYFLCRFSYMLSCMVLFSCCAYLVCLMCLAGRWRGVRSGTFFRCCLVRLSFLYVGVVLFWLYCCLLIVCYYLCSCLLFIGSNTLICCTRWYLNHIILLM